MDKLDTMTTEQKWAALGKQYELLNQCQQNINVLRQSLAQEQQDPKED